MLSIVANSISDSLSLRWMNEGTLVRGDVDVDPQERLGPESWVR